MFRVVHLDKESYQSYFACWLRQIYIWRKLTVTDNPQWESSSQMHTRTTATITVTIFVDIFVCIAFRVCRADRCVSMFKDCTRHKQSSPVIAKNRLRRLALLCAFCVSLWLLCCTERTQKVFMKGIFQFYCYSSPAAAAAAAAAVATVCIDFDPAFPAARCMAAPTL